MYHAISIGFTGEYEDVVTCAYPLGSGYRWFLPSLMRFNALDSESPFGVGGIHPYSYCADDPINRIDPTGHMFSIYGLTAEETMSALEEMDARQAAPKAAPKTDPMPNAGTFGSSHRQGVDMTDAAATHASANVSPQSGVPSGSGAIGAHHAVGAATSPIAEPAPGMHPQTGNVHPPDANVHPISTFKQVLNDAKPEIAGRRKEVRARAAGVVKALQRQFPGQVRSITTLLGYNESELKRYLGSPKYESLRTQIRRYASKTSGRPAQADWKRMAPYFAVDVSDV
ncbi:RHS repeat-associated core domain-containing protein [Trinickia sp. NRRL B-1857]|uniref:RHS repeat-associated core domain-containing protein n=1 Tax=Trinickia sp. NRRL B-1857 TaxID=3162879 RepID=UPI003D273790